VEILSARGNKIQLFPRLLLHLYRGRNG
jgi:hypothetical protein